MIGPEIRGAWRELEVELRPFIARRLPAEADVDDVMQDVFLRMQRGLSGLRDEERFGPWVYQVTRHAITDHLRQVARHRPANDRATRFAGDERADGGRADDGRADGGRADGGRADDGRDADAPSVDAWAHIDEQGFDRLLQRTIALLVALLPSPYREAVTLTEIEGYTQKEAAEKLGTSLSAMKSRVQRGRERLRAALEDCCVVALDARGHVVACEPRRGGRLPNGVLTRQFLPERSPAPIDKVPQTLAPVASLWRRADIHDAGGWTVEVTLSERAELAHLATQLRGRAISSLTADDLPRDGPLCAAAQRWRQALDTGPGFVLVRGFDVEGVDPEVLGMRFAILGRFMGTLVPQNLRGELLTHVRDTGADPLDKSTRLYTTRAEQDFHTDGADIVGLLCRRTARSGGLSRIVSSAAVVLEMQRVRPDLFRALFDDFPWHYQEEGTPPMLLERPICTVPATTLKGALLNTFYIGWYIRRSQELTDAPRLSPTQLEAMAMLEALANDPRFFVDMRFAPGDAQWLKNAAILHKRTAYEDHENQEDKRHLLRLWVSAPDLADGDAQLRAGVVRPE
jgi:RNA polymerase sigma factor (sigma-70 family)